MPIAGKIFRVFVSSTFDDLKVERNALRESVFPRIQALCASRGARFQAIDLRWGVSSEAALDQQALPICLAEIDRCQRLSPRPNFILLLGDRYGWRPPPPTIAEELFQMLIRYVQTDERELLEQWYRLDNNAIPPVYCLQAREGPYIDDASWDRTERRLVSILERASRHGGLDTKACIGASATEHEIDAGVFAAELNISTQEHVFAFFRSIEGLPENSSARAFRDIDPEGHEDSAAAERLARLKQRLRKRLGENVRDYRCLWLGTDDALIDHSYIQQLCEDVYQSLRKVILHELDKLGEVDEVELEIESHAEFGRERCLHFVGRNAELDRVAKYLTSEETLASLVVSGPPGAGKSALLGRMVQQARDAHDNAVVVQRFIGASSKSTNGIELLRSICTEIADAYSVAEEDIGGSYSDYVHRLFALLDEATTARPLFVFVDALDQLGPHDPARDLAWLPFQTQSGFRFVVSFITGKMEDAEARVRPGQSIKLESLAPVEGAELLDLWLNDVRRDVTSEQRALVLRGFQSDPRPLYLRIAFEFAHRWRSYDVPSPLASDIAGIIADYISELADRRNHGPLLVGRVLGLLAAAKHGLAEDELLDLLVADDAVYDDFLAKTRHPLPSRGLPVVVWSRLHLDLEPFMGERTADGALVYSFYHGQFREAALNSKLVDVPAAHDSIARYFQGQPLERHDGGIRAPNVRKMAEQPYQQMNAGLWPALEASLTNFAFIDAKIRALGAQAMIEDFESLAGTDYENRELPLIGGAIRLSSHIVDRDPDLLSSQLFGRLVDSQEPLIQRLVDEARASAPDIWLRPLSSSLEHPGGPCTRILDGYTDRSWGANWSMALLDEDVLLTAGPASESSLKLWNVNTGAVVSEIEKPDESVSRLLITGPDRAVTLAGGDLRFWDLAAGTQICAVEFEKKPGDDMMDLFALPSLQRDRDRLSGGIISIGVEPNRHRIAGGLADGTVRIWRLADGEQLTTLDHTELPRGPVPPGHAHQVNTLVFLGDDCLLTKSYRTVRLWNLATGEQIRRYDLEHPAYFQSFKIVADKRNAVFTKAVPQHDDKANELFVWDLDSGSLCRKGHYSPELTVHALVPGTEHLLGSSVDRAFGVWDINSGEPLWVSQDVPFSSCSSLTRDGRTALVADQEGALRLWDLEQGQVVSVTEGHAGGVQAILICEDSGRVFTASDDHTIRIWDFDSMKAHKTSTRFHGALLEIAVPGDMPIAVAAHLDGAVTTWDIETGRYRCELGRHTADAQSVVVSETGSIAASGDRKGVAKLWDLKEANLLTTLNTGMLFLKQLAFSAGGERIAVPIGSSGGETDIAAERASSRVTDTAPIVPLASEEGSSLMSVRDVAANEEITRMKTCGYPQAVALSEDGRVLVSAGDGVIEVWRVDDATLLRCYDHLVMESDIRLAVSTDFSTVVCSVQGGRIAVIDLPSGAEPRIFEPQFEGVKELCLYGEGDAQRLIVAGRYAIGAFELDTFAQTAQFIDGDPANRIVVSVDERYLIGGFSSGAVRIWDLATTEQLAYFVGDAGISTLQLSIYGPTVVAGDYRGWVHTLRFEGGTQERRIGLHRTDGIAMFAAEADGEERLRRARGLTVRARAFDKKNAFDAVVECSEAALAMVEQEDERTRASESWQLINAGALVHIGQARFTQSDFAGAQETFSRARSVLIPLTSANPEDAAIAGFLTQAHTRLGFAAQALGDLDTAMGSQDSAIAASDKIAEDDPDDRELHEMRGRAQFARGTMLEAAGDQFAAAQAYYAALGEINPFGNYVFDAPLQRLRISTMTSFGRTIFNAGNPDNFELAEEKLIGTIGTGELLERYAQKDFDTLRNLAQAQLLIARLQSAKADWTAVVEACQATIALIEAWPHGWAGVAEPATWSEDPALMETAASALIEQGHAMQEQGEPAAALQSLARATSITADMLKACPDDVRILQLRAAALQQRAQIEQLQGEIGAAVDTIQVALESVDRALASEEVDPSAQELRAYAELKLGELLAHQGDSDNAAHHIANVVNAVEEVMRDAPTISWGRLYATAIVQWGYICNARGDQETALEALRVAQTNIEALFVDIPNDPTLVHLQTQITDLLEELDPPD